MSNVENALAALGGNTPEVSADPVTQVAQIPQEVITLAAKAAKAQDVAQAAAAIAKVAGEAAAELASDLKAAMGEFKLGAVPLADREDITLSHTPEKKKAAQTSMKAIKVTLADLSEANARAVAGDSITDALVAAARKVGVAAGTELWKALPRPIAPATIKLSIPEAREIEAPE